MKQIIAAAILAVGAVVSHPAWTTEETKKVCVDVKDKDGKTVMDSKTNQPKQNCREVKQHQKLEGTKIPDKK